MQSRKLCIRRAALRRQYTVTWWTPTAILNITTEITALIIMTAQRESTTMLSQWAGMTITAGTTSTKRRRRMAHLSVRTAGARTLAMRDISIYHIMMRTYARQALCTRSWSRLTITTRFIRRTSLAGSACQDLTMKRHILQMCTRRARMRNSLRWHFMQQAPRPHMKSML